MAAPHQPTHQRLPLDPVPRPSSDASPLLGDRLCRRPTPPTVRRSPEGGSAVHARARPLVDVGRRTAVPATAWSAQMPRRRRRHAGPARPTRSSRRSPQRLSREPNFSHGVRGAGADCWNLTEMVVARGTIVPPYQRLVLPTRRNRLPAASAPCDDRHLVQRGHRQRGSSAAGFVAGRALSAADLRRPRTPGLVPSYPIHPYDGPEGAVLPSRPGVARSRRRRELEQG